MIHFTRRLTYLFSSIAVILLTVSSLQAQIIYVNSAATGANTGLNWNDAFTDLNPALQAAPPGFGIQIYVAAGTYIPVQPAGATATCDERDESFILKNGVELLGGFPNTGTPTLAMRDPVANPTILSGDLLGDTPDGTFANTIDNSFNVVVASPIGTPTDATAILDGFIVEKGNADNILALPLASTCSGGYGSNLLSGAGIRANGGSPTIRNCVIRNNSAEFGGGVFLESSSNMTLTDCSVLANRGTSFSGGIQMETNCAPVFTNCIVNDNFILKLNSFAGSGVGFIFDSAPTFNNCSFDNNESNEGFSDAFWVRSNSTPTFNDCSFSNHNSNSSFGGVAFIENTSTVTFNTCTFSNNSATEGVIYNEGSTLNITNSTFQANSSVNGNGGALYSVNDGADAATTTVNNSSFNSNTASQNGGASYDTGDATTTFSNCNFSGNSAQNGGAVANAAGATTSVVSSLQCGNVATTDGAANFSDGAILSVINSTVVNNTAQGNGGGFAGINNATSASVNSIFYSNTDGSGSLESGQFYTDGSGSYTIFTSIIEGLATLVHTASIGDDPQFMNALGVDGIACTADDNYMPAPCSPAVDAGTTALVPVGNTVDFGGNPRTFNGTVDMGAVEYQGAPQLLETDATTITNVLCFGNTTGSVQVDATFGLAPYTYQWDAGAGSSTNDTVTGLAAGSYFVTVTDAFGCQMLDTATVTQPAAALAASTGSIVNVACFGNSTGAATASAQGGTTPYTYQWSVTAGSQTTATATGLSAGTYLVTVTDANGCTDVTSATITQPAAPLVASSVVNANATCFGSTDASATVSAIGGTGAYTFQWDAAAGNQTTATATGLGAGAYTVIVTDSNGCTDNAVVNITEPTQVVVSFQAVTGTLCNGSSDGQATIVANGGNSTSFTYLWDNGETTATATMLSAGVHAVTVTNGNGCIGTGQVTINEPNPVIVNGYQSQPVSCNGGSDGQASSQYFGGIAPYTFLWDAAAGNQTTETATGLAAGTYTVTVTDVNGCTGTDQITINDPTPLSNTVIVDDALCNGDGNGAVGIQSTGGIAPYSYDWSVAGVGNGSVATGLAAGNYTVTVTDARGCTAIENATVSQPAPLTGTTSATNDNGSMNGTASVFPTGGVGGYSFLWDDPMAQTSNVATGLEFGFYEVIVSDANGCTQSFVVEVERDDNVGCISNIMTITPNNDSKNDTWELPCIAFIDNEVQVFNRWGQEVFAANNYSSGWDGTYEGNKLPEGGYFFVVKAQLPTGERILKGGLNIVR